MRSTRDVGSFIRRIERRPHELRQLELFRLKAAAQRVYGIDGGQREPGQVQAVASNRLDLAARGPAAGNRFHGVIVSSPLNVHVKVMTPNSKPA